MPRFAKTAWICHGRKKAPDRQKFRPRFRRESQASPEETRHASEASLPARSRSTAQVNSITDSEKITGTASPILGPFPRFGGTGTPLL